MKSNLANLDILRSFAVLLVAAGHFLLYDGKYRWTGWIGLTGVCLFFVHTCLVLMWSLERDPHSGRFYIRRLFRLFPLWLVVLGAVVLFHIPTSPILAPAFGYVAPSAAELFANATLTFNLRYGARIVGASWSLPIEAQMYLLLPLLFFFVRSTRALWLLLILDAFVIVSVWSSGDHNNSNLAMCIPYFLPGVMAYLLSKKVKPILPPWSFLLFLVLGAAVHFRYGTLFFSSFFCLIVGLSLPFFHQIRWRPLTRASHYIARYSYGIYLCHIPSIFIGLHYMRAHSLPVRLGVIALCVVVSSVTLYHLVEEPMIRLGAKVAKKFEPGPGPRVDATTLDMEPAP